MNGVNVICAQRWSTQEISLHCNYKVTKYSPMTKTLCDSIHCRVNLLSGVGGLLWDCFFVI